MTDDPARHWDSVHSTRAAEETSWYRAEATASLRLLAEALSATGGLPGSIVDVGAGSSTLVDELLSAGWGPVTALDVSAAALEQTRSRLPEAADVRFVVSDVLQWRPEETFDAWHDRAVFHFLTERAAQDRYVGLAARTVRPGGVLVIGTFAPGGPERCSGLPVARHDLGSLHARFTPRFDVLSVETEVHVTPWGAAQPFTWATMQRHS
jgi:SAM-dependent methyltransferase